MSDIIKQIEDAQKKSVLPEFRVGDTRYNDQSILIESLEKQETRLLEMMDKAETIEDMITIESRLSEVQTQLNQARNTLAGYDTDIDYSTINVQIEEVPFFKGTN